MNIKKYLPILYDCSPPKEAIQKTVVVAFFYIICLYIMSVMVVVAGLRYPKHKEPLPDLLFDIIPANYEFEWLPNLLLLLLALASIIRCIFFRRGLTVIRRFFLLHGISSLLRSATLAATSYPDPSRLCANYTPPDSVDPFWTSTVYNPELVTCGDLMFSGHTLYYCLLALLWTRYFTILEKTVMWIIAIIGCFSLIFVRIHYTTDVLVGIYVAFTVYYFYHLHVTDEVSTTTTTIGINNHWTNNPLIDWFEKSSDRKMEQELLLELETHPDETV